MGEGAGNMGPPSALLWSLVSEASAPRLQTG